MGGSHYSNLTAGESPPLQILQVFRYQQVANIEARFESEPIAKGLCKFSRFTPFAFCVHSACGISEWITHASVPGSGSSFSSSGLYVHKYMEVGLESGLIPVAPIACPGPCLQWVWMLGFSKISSVGFVSKCLRYIQAYCQHSLSLGEAKNSANDSVVYVQHNRWLVVSNVTEHSFHVDSFCKRIFRGFSSTGSKTILPTSPCSLELKPETATPTNQEQTLPPNWTVINTE